MNTRLGFKFAKVRTPTNPFAMTTKILLVEDDETLGFLLSEFLQSRGFEVVWAKDGVDGLRQFNAYDHQFDLCLLDVMMPGLDGFTVAELLRNPKGPAGRPGTLPIIFLTAKSLHADVVRGFKAGADDYIKKPVDEEELVARIEAVLKRTTANEAGPGSDEHTVFQLGSYVFDSVKCQLQLAGKMTSLTEMEARLLKIFCEKTGQLVQRDWVLEKIWGRNDFLARKSMDVFISRLRKYLADDPRIHITNLHGSGFVLEVD